MSIDRTEYVIYGFLVNREDVSDELMEKYSHGGKDVLPKFILYDGMSGKYVIAGNRIVRGDSYEGIDLTVIDTDKLHEQDHDLIMWMFNNFTPGWITRTPPSNGINPSAIPRLFVVTHWS